MQINPAHRYPPGQPQAASHRTFSQWGKVARGSCEQASKIPLQSESVSHGCAQYVIVAPSTVAATHRWPAGHSVSSAQSMQIPPAGYIEHSEPLQSASLRHATRSSGSSVGATQPSAPGSGESSPELVDTSGLLSASSPREEASSPVGSPPHATMLDITTARARAATQRLTGTSRPTDCSCADPRDRDSAPTGPSDHHRSASHSRLRRRAHRAPLRRGRSPRSRTRDRDWLLGS